MRRVRFLGRMIGTALTCLGLLAAQSLPSGPITGDPRAGRTLFEGKGGCLQCHSIDSKGGSLGPDLTGIGRKRSGEALRLAITDPDAEIHSDYVTITVLTEQGEQISGLRLNEDDYSLQLRDTAANLRSIPKSSLQDLRRELRSLMPSYAAVLSGPEIDDLVAYLRSLQREEAPLRGATRTRGNAPLFRAEHADWLTRPGREATEQPEKVLEALQIGEGTTVADVGAGVGYFTWRLAERVGPKGKVIAVEIQQKMLDLLADNLKKRNLTNVEMVLGEARDPRLPQGALDLALLVNTYHEFSEPVSMMTAIHRALKPSGRLVLVEYRKEDPRPQQNLWVDSGSGSRPKL